MAAGRGTPEKKLLDEPGKGRAAPLTSEGLHGLRHSGGVGVGAVVRVTG